MPVPRYRLEKRVFDLVGATLALVVLTPLLAGVALAIWLSDPGAPVFFRQSRCGAAGRQFVLLKFRTMIRDADALKEALRSRSSVSWPDFSLDDDPRVTRIGRFLRRTSIDELPQLLNVIKGDMSLVGPRPTSFPAETYTLWQTERLDFQPGLTGPWQVWGRNGMEFPDRCRLEISFFREPAFHRDLWLLLLTVASVVRRPGAA
jgi:lipopolysaccharide/colanic/teichoic acid biosynthesis glycosyltransferase